MKNKIFKILILIILVIAIVFFVKNKTVNEKNNDDTETTTTTTTESEAIRTDILNTVSKSSYIESALEEKKELHATYYFEEIYVQENQYVASGENILKYTNGTYMTAPYNCVITEIFVPDVDDMCTNEHYITIQSTDTLKISLSVDEENISKVYLGQTAEIELDVFSDKEISGYITNIDNSATYNSSGSTFNVDVEFQNDGDISLGMSAKCSIILEKAENVIGVASEAVEEQNGEKYVTVKTDDDKTTEVKVETGISNDAYTEIKNGINEGDIVVIEKEESDSKSDKMNFRMQNGGQGGGQENFERMNSGGGERPSGMPEMK